MPGPPEPRLRRSRVSIPRLMAVSRALVPVDYTTGDRFTPDPAISQPAWPPLDGLRRLARCSIRARLAGSSRSVGDAGAQPNGVRLGSGDHGVGCRADGVTESGIRKRAAAEHRAALITGGPAGLAASSLPHCAARGLPSRSSTAIPDASRMRLPGLHVCLGLVLSVCRPM